MAPVCEHCLAVKRGFLSSPAGTEFAQTLCFPRFNTDPPGPLAFGAHFAQNVSFSSGGSDRCSPEQVFSRVDCVLGTFLGKVIFFLAFGGLFDFRFSENTAERLR